jgi:citrate synthase
MTAGSHAGREDVGAPTFSTGIASHDLHHIWVRGIDLVDDVIGVRSFTETVFLLVAGRMPTPEETRMLDAILVSLVEHGLTPSAVVARVTYSVAPESLQGAIAAGLLGAGSVVLGSMEECGRILTQVQAAADSGSSRSGVVSAVVDEYLRDGRRLPGVGHAIHREGDPRAARLFVLADEYGFSGVHVQTLKEFAEVAESKTGKSLPINVTGAVSAILLELGVPWRLHRGFALISRSAGLVAHVGEEIEQPITPNLRRLVR